MIDKYQWKTIHDLRELSELPDPFLKPSGARVSSPEEWSSQRMFLKEMLAHYMYGHMPPAPTNTIGKVISSESVYEGKAIKEVVHITFGPDSNCSFDVHILRPNKKGRFPVITWNHSKGLQPCPLEREAVCERDYILAFYDREQLGADSYNFCEESKCIKAYPSYDWRAIAVWSWGHSRTIDYLDTTDYADMERIIATGHSRGGKVALCAAIFDERIALCAPNASGCGGAGNFRFMGSRMGEGIGLCESLGSITEMFRHWWQDDFGMFGLHSPVYDGTPMKFTMQDIVENRIVLNTDYFGKTENETLLPFDLHIARALIAPRPIISTEGLEDTWSNPYGSLVTWRAADEVYEFNGTLEKNAIHFREGGHAYLALDWSVVLDFCDNMLLDKTLPARYITVVAPVGHNRFLSNMNNAWYERRLHYSWRGPQLQL